MPRPSNASENIPPNRGEIAESLDRFFFSGFGDSQHPQRLCLMTGEHLLKWLDREGLTIERKE